MSLDVRTPAGALFLVLGGLLAVYGMLSDPAIYQDGPRAKDLVGEYERLRAELESLWQRIGEL